VFIRGELVGWLLAEYDSVGIVGNVGRRVLS